MRGLTRGRRRLFAALLLSVPVLGACGDDVSGTDTSNGERPTVVVTTGILGDVVADLVGDAADVVTVMPDGASPHDFQASARQVDQIRRADALVVNGGGFEEGLLDVIDAAEADGVRTYAAIDAVDTRPLDDDHGDDAAHDDDAVDPHFFVDPVRMADAAEGILDFLTDTVPSLDDGDVRRRAGEQIDALRALGAEVEQILADIPDDRRVLVTNHEVFGYFADRFDFEVVGAVIPGGATGESVSASDLSALADLVAERGIRAVFADTSSPDELARTLADEVGGVAVVELFSESLGGPGSGGETYEEMVRTNAERIAAALG